MVVLYLKPEIYVSTDVETDGPIPGPNSMISFASIAFSRSGKELSQFSANLRPLKGARRDKKTMHWWKGRPRAWLAATRLPEEPALVMKRYVRWLDSLPGTPVFVAYPLLFDMMFVYWYLMKFVGRSPFSHSGIDIKSMAFAALGSVRYRDVLKSRMPQRWRPSNVKHRHVALVDAREQGHLFFEIRDFLKSSVPRSR
jgi:hypothetical protein